MDPEEELKLLEEIINEILAGLQDTIQSGEILSDAFQGAIAEELEHTTARMDYLRNRIREQDIPERSITPQEATTGQKIPSSATLLWILAGEDDRAFRAYINQFPDPELMAIAANPAKLNQLIEHLSESVSMEAGKSAEGIPHANLQSSNIYGFQYSPRDQKLRVKFQGDGAEGQGSIYEYEGVPPNIFKMFRSGAVPAKTTGKNQWGMWWTGKTPSLGASFHELIKLGGYPYQKMS